MPAEERPTAAERTAVLRAEVRIRWPGTRFSVRPGRGGSSVIRWTDGPNFAAVEQVLDDLERRFTRVVEVETAAGRRRWCGPRGQPGARPRRPRM